METPPSRSLRPRRAAQPACSPGKPCFSCTPNAARRLFQKDQSSRFESNSGGQDPVEVLGEDVFLNVLGCLDCHALVACTLVCKSWENLVRDDVLWLSHYEELCKDKAAVPKAALQAQSKMAAFGICVQDAKRVGWPLLLGALKCAISCCTLGHVFQCIKILPIALFRFP
jgi:hypothetical protein